MPFKAYKNAASLGKFSDPKSIEVEQPRRIEQPVRK